MGGWRVAWLGVEDDRGLAAVLIRCGVVRLLLPCRHSNNLLTVRDSPQHRQQPLVTHHVWTLCKIDSKVTLSLILSAPNTSLHY